MNFRGLVWRELIGSSHRRSTYVLRSLYVGLTAVLAFSFAWSDVRPGRGAPGGDLFLALGLAQILCLGALSLFLAHFSLAAEKTSGRLDLLLATGRRRSGIVTGKLAGALALPFFLFLAGLPAMLVAVSLGGVSGEDLLGLAAIVLAMIVLMGSFGAVGGSVGSLGLTFVLPAVYLLAPPLLDEMDLVSMYGDELFEYTWLPLAVEAVLDGPFVWPNVPCAVASSLALSGACLFVSVLLLPRQRSGWLARTLHALGREVRELNARFARGAVLIRSHSRRLLWSRPLVWREECRSPLTTRAARARFAALMLIACCVFWACLYGAPMGPWQRDDLFEMTTALWCVGLLLAPGVWAARAASVDKSRGMLAILLASPARDRGIVLACVRSTATLFAIPLFFLFLHELAGWACGVDRLGWMGSIVAASGIFFGATVGAACGYSAKTQARAVLGFLGALVVWVAAGPLAVVVLDEITWYVDLEWLLYTSPLSVLFDPLPSMRGRLLWLAPAIGAAAGAAALYLSVKRLRSWLR